MRAAAADLTGVAQALASAWERSDRLFRLLAPAAWRAQPIPLRQPFLFYLGHLPAFAWNHLGRGRRGRAAFRPDLDTLFERGIDPVGVDAYTPAAEWPELDDVRAYRDGVRAALADVLADPLAPEDERVAEMVIEHEQMHHETLLYMLQELSHDLKRRPADGPEPPTSSPAPPPPRRIAITGGETVLGAPRNAASFRWDNELPEWRVRVPGFDIDDRPVTNGEILQLVRDGGYAEPRLWREDDWAWRHRNGIEHPHGWRRTPSSFVVRTLFEDVPVEAVLNWPASVSWAEAAAYARWQGARLPTEAEYHRAAYDAPDGSRRRWPWGEAPPAAEHGNFGFLHWSPTPVASHPAGVSAWGVHDLMGDGWEWTGSPFAPFPGFAPLERYPGYSADFFDGRHFVLRGASWATDARLARASFRNWFQPHYPYVFAKFRCVRRV